MKYCIHCGYKLIPDSKFCGNCGRKIDGINPSEVPVSSAHQTTHEKSSLVKNIFNNLLQQQTVSLGIHGSISLNCASKKFHITLYDVKIKGIFFKSRVRGKCIIDKKLNFNQLLDYKIVNQHDVQRSSVKGEKFTGFRESHIYSLGVELLVDSKQGFYFVNFGGFWSFSAFPGKDYEKAMSFLGKLSAALEKIKQMR